MNGEELERLVERLERMLVPTGFEIETRQRVFGPSGQIAEFDVVVSGRLGSADVKCLIECRDRPSEGAAAASWIEQLVGRRSRFKFDKVLAVSTTGFAPGAVEYAERIGIELRSARQIEADDLVEWFTTKRVTVTHREMRTEWCSLVLQEESEPAAYQEAVTLLTVTKQDIPLFQFDNYDRRISGHQLTFATIMSAPDLWPKKAELDLPWQKRVAIELRFSAGMRFYIDTSSGRVFVTRIKFVGTLLSRLETLRFTSVSEYSNDVTGETIGRSATAKVALPQGSATVALNRVAEVNSETLAVYLDQAFEGNWVATLDG